MRFSRVIFTVLLISVMALIGGCMETNTESLAVISVTMVNASGNDIPILASGEEAGPGNRLAPGQSRLALVTGKVYEVESLLSGEVAFQGVALNFYAVRNGKRMTATECDAEGQPDDESWEDKTVTYTEDVTLEKTTGSPGCG